MESADTQSSNVAVTISGTPPNLQWSAAPDPLEVDQENLINYQLSNQSPTPLVFCAVDVEPSSPQFQVQSIRPTQIQLLDQDLTAGSFAVYLWVQDRNGQRYRSPDPQVINRR